ncbi:MAG: acetylxylan esterase [Bacteroidia bacterium]|nr:acetylxylan esterase [Bacteroidia bacterium]
MKNNRRGFLKLSGLTGIGFVGAGILPTYGNKMLSQPALALEPGDISPLVPLNRFPRMVHEYFVGRVRQVEQKADNRRSALRTRSDAENYVREVRAKIQQCFGPWPDKTPLNARVTGMLERDTYNIEKVIFESRPGFQVTANLYVPKGRKMPLPAVVGTCGHSNNGKAYPGYQSFAQGLARKGYVVLIFDPVGQGERLQYLNSEFKPRHGISVMEHLYTGNQMVLTGESLNSWFAWDGIRALDYLLTRPEVDPKHIGVTGNSGGGTQTTWLCGVEPRFTMAAPSCFVTTFLHNLENELPADNEQYPPYALVLGLDHSDFIAAMAPKPVILLGQEKDFFDARGLEESIARLKYLYRLLGAEQNIQLFVGPDYHGYSQLNREAMYGCFNRVTKISNTNEEPLIVLEKEETLWCTPHGQVGESGSRNVFSFTSQLSGSLKNKRGSLNGDALKQAVIDALKLPQYTGVPDFRILRPVPNRLYPKKFSGIYLVETEANISIPVYRLDDNELVSRPPVGLKRALLYVSHQSADDELRQEPLLAELIRTEPNSAVFACDVRGIGESQPNTCDNDFLEPYGNDYFYAEHSIMLDYPYVGQKTFDVLRVISLLKSYGHEEIHLIGKGWGAIPATFAALLSDTVSQITLKNALTSYSDIAENEEYNWPLSSLLPGVLRTFDLPDCYRALASKNLRQIEPWNANAGKA